MRIVKAFELLRIQAPSPKVADERFEMGIVNELAGVDEAHINTPEVGPCIEVIERELRPGVHRNGSRSTRMHGHAIECLGDQLRWEAIYDLQTQAFPRETVDHRKQANPSPIG
jgi:hypothetical protein